MTNGGELQPNPQDCKVASWRSSDRIDGLLRRQLISMSCPRFPDGSPISTYSVRVREQKSLGLDEAKKGHGAGTIGAAICLGCEFFESLEH